MDASAGRATLVHWRLPEVPCPKLHSKKKIGGWRLHEWFVINAKKKLNWESGFAEIRVWKHELLVTLNINPFAEESFHCTPWVERVNHIHSLQQFSVRTSKLKRRHFFFERWKLFLFTSLGSPPSWSFFLWGGKGSNYVGRSVTTFLRRKPTLSFQGSPYYTGSCKALPPGHDSPAAWIPNEKSPIAAFCCELFPTFWWHTIYKKGGGNFDFFSVGRGACFSKFWVWRNLKEKKLVEL